MSGGRQSAEALGILAIGPATGPVGSGPTGGVSRRFLATCHGLARLGHAVHAFIGSGSEAAALEAGRIDVTVVPGRFQPTREDEPGGSYPILADALVTNFVATAADRQHRFDAILNFCHDFLPYHVTPLFRTPIFHIPTVAEAGTVTAAEIRRIAQRTPWRIAAQSKAQRDALGLGPAVVVIPRPLDLDDFPFRDAPIAPRPHLLAVARISAEKGLGDAAEAARRVGRRLRICGHLAEPDLLADLAARHGPAIDYAGFLDGPALPAEYSAARALVMTHRWVEALGAVALEAMACGTPVVTYDRGGPAETVIDGKTGFVVPADDVGAVAAALRRVDEIDPLACRRQVEDRYAARLVVPHIAAWLRRGVERAADRTAPAA